MEFYDDQANGAKIYVAGAFSATCYWIVSSEKVMWTYSRVDFVMQAVLWYTDTLKTKTTLEEHSSLITDVRFSPSMPRLATSSFDKTVRVWDADNVSWHFLISLHA